MGGCFGQCGGWSAQPDFVVGDEDFREEEADVGLAEGGVVAAEGRAQGGGGAGDRLGGDGDARGAGGGVEQADAVGGGLAGEFGGVQPLLQRGIVAVHQALLDEVEQAGHAALCLGQGAAGLRQVIASCGVSLGRAGDVGVQHEQQAFGREQAVGEMVEHHAVERRHGDAASGAGGLSLLRAAGAGVVAIAPALAGADGHPGAAGAAAGDAGQEGRAADDARRRAPRAARPQAGHDLIVVLGRDDRRHRDRDPLLGGLAASGLRVAAVEVEGARVGLRRQDAVDAGDVERLAAVQHAPGVERVDDRLDAEGQSGAAEREVVDAAHDGGLGLVDDEDFLDLLAALSGRRGPVAEGRRGAVPEPLPRVLLHGAQGVLGVLARLVFVERAEDLTDQVAGGVVAELLRHGDELDARAAQLAEIHL